MLCIHIWWWKSKTTGQQQQQQQLSSVSGKSSQRNTRDTPACGPLQALSHRYPTCPRVESSRVELSLRYPYPYFSRVSHTCSIRICIICTYIYVYTRIDLQLPLEAYSAGKYSPHWISTLHPSCFTLLYPELRSTYSIYLYICIRLIWWNTLHTLDSMIFAIRCDGAWGES